MSSPPKFKIEGSKINSKETALSEIKNTLKLGSGLGENYDSLEECIQSDYWPELQKFDLLIEDFTKMSESVPAEVLNTLLGVFKDASLNWEKTRGPHTFNIYAVVG